MATLRVKNVNLVTVKKGTDKESERIAIGLEDGNVIFVSTQIILHALGLPYTKKNGEKVTAKMIAEMKEKSKASAEAKKKGA